MARLAGIKPYVLRFWETEFPALGPRKSGTGHRLYRRKDVEMVLEIKRLLYEQRFTIEGARKFLETRAKTEAAARRLRNRPRRKAAQRRPRQPRPPRRRRICSAMAPSPTLDARSAQELREILTLLK